MRFATKEDLTEPLDAVFAAISDFAGLERVANRRGISVTRADRMTIKGAGMMWDVGFKMRGRPRKAVIELTSYDPGGGMRLTATSSNLEMTMVLSLVALARNRTRLAVEMEVLPKTMAARLLIQSARLGKKRLDSRFRDRVRTFVKYLNERMAPR